MAVPAVTGDARPPSPARPRTRSSATAVKYRRSTALFARSRSADTGGATSGASVTGRMRCCVGIAARMRCGGASSPLRFPASTGSLTNAMSRSPAKASGETWAVSCRSAGLKRAASPVLFSFRTSPVTARTSSTRLAGDRLAGNCGDSAAGAVTAATGTSRRADADGPPPPGPSDQQRQAQHGEQDIALLMKRPDQGHTDQAGNRSAGSGSPKAATDRRPRRGRSGRARRPPSRDDRPSQPSEYPRALLVPGR